MPPFYNIYKAPSFPVSDLSEEPESDVSGVEIPERSQLNSEEL